MNYKLLHPYTLLVIIKKFLALLAVPLIGQIIWSILIKYNIVKKNLALVNAFITVFIISCILIKYFTAMLQITDTKIKFKRGILKKRIFLISTSYIKLFKVENNLISRSVGAYKLKIIKSSIYNPLEEGVYVNHKTINNIINKNVKDQKLELIKANSMFRSIILSLFLFSPIKVLFVCIPFIKKANKILNSSVKNKIYKTLDVRPYFVSLGVSPIVSSVIFIVILVIMLSAFINFLNFGKFKLKNSSDFLSTESGILRKHKSFMEKQALNAVSVKYTLFMKIFKIASVYYHINMSKKFKNDNLLLLGDKYKNALALTKSLGYKKNDDLKIKKISRSIKGFILWPVCCIVLILFLMFKVSGKYNSKILLIFLELFLVYAIWYLAAKIVCYKNTCVSVTDKDTILLKGYKGKFIIEAYIKPKAIKSVIIKQNIFQRYSELCTIYFYTSPNKHDIFFAKNLKYSDATQFLNFINMSRENQ